MIILIFDSLPDINYLKNSIRVQDTVLRQYMKDKWDEEFPWAKYDLRDESIAIHHVSAPVQSNGYDCGLYLLENVERFLKVRSS